jgi:dipeptidyl aminopeptidase/acylaminoacyl peptidase
MIAGKQVRAYGDWPSPVTAGWLAGRLRLEEVQWTPDGDGLIWVEGRSGQGMLVHRRPGGEPRDLLGEQSARGGLFYGGGEFSLSKGWVYYIDRGRQLFRRRLDQGEPEALTTDEYWLAAPTPAPDGGWVAMISSDGQDDWISLLDAAGAHPPRRLAQGADFYMQPSWSPDGSMLVWVEWNHPNLPWDATRITLARLEGEPPTAAERIQIAGDGRGNFTQPRFSPDGRWLSYIASRGEWDTLMLYDLASGNHCAVLEGERVLLSMPAWVQGVRSTAWSFDSQRVFVIQHYAGRAELLAVEIASGKSSRIDTRPYTWLRQISASPRSEGLILIASSPQLPDRIILWDGRGWQVSARSDVQPLPEEYFSVPQELSWRSADGDKLHAFYFPPSHPQFTGQGAPPLIVSVHGGPTHLERLEFPKEAPYFTSRGYAWLEVCYRGSLGYGRSYKAALNGRWGELDLEDVTSASEEVVRRGLADRSRLALYGGSAGGLTVLNALAKYPGRFKAGICLYPVTDLLDPGLVADKFESRFLDGLVGPLPTAEPLYRQRSPLYHADQIRDPLAIFHGREDTAVPVGQSVQIAENLRSRGVPVLLQIYEGEGHGFRLAENLEDCYQKIERFLKDQFNRKA